MEMKGVELCRDPVWMKDAVSKFLESHVYSVPLLDFIDENCGMFDDSEDNKLEYTIVHENFKELVDGLISDFLNSLGISIPTFVQMLANEMHSSLYSIVMTSILTVDNFILFKEMMLKRNFQISNQTLNQIANQFQELEGPADLHSVIDHLSDISKQQHSDKEAAKPLSLVDAFQQQAKIKDKDLNAKSLHTLSFSKVMKEEKKGHHNYIEFGDECKEEHYKHEKENVVNPQDLKEDIKDIVEIPSTLDNSFCGEESNRDSSILLISESSILKREEGNLKCDKVQILEQKTTTIMIPEYVCSIKENQKENTRITKLSFESPCEVVILEELEKNPLQYEEDFGDNLNKANHMNGEMQEHIKEEALELTTNKLLESLLADVNQWKPKSLKLNANDGEIQQRRRYLQQQRDRILAQKKSAREKQIRFFRQLESKADAIPQKLKQPMMPMTALHKDTEANKKRESLRKELARCLKEELTNKTSNMSPTSKKIYV